jgi:Cu-Zn family superoxide dismutase
LTPQVQRKPITIDWHEESQSFFVGVLDDGTIYRGSLDDPAAVVHLEGRRGQSAHGIDVVGNRMFVAGGLYGSIRVYDLESREQVGNFDTGSGGLVTDLVVTRSGHVWATDLVRPVLWHLTPELVAAGSGTPLALPLTPEMTFVATPDNSYGIVALSDQRLVVDKHIDGTLYVIELDQQAPQGRTITRIGGITVPLGEDMTFDGNSLVVADNDGLSVVELSPDGRQGRLVRQLRDPSFRQTASVARAGDRYLVVNTAWDGRTPDTISSIPAA